MRASGAGVMLSPQAKRPVALDVVYFTPKVSFFLMEERLAIGACQVALHEFQGQPGHSLVKLHLCQ